MDKIQHKGKEYRIVVGTKDGLEVDNLTIYDGNRKIFTHCILIPLLKSDLVRILNNDIIAQRKLKLKNLH